MNVNKKQLQEYKSGARVNAIMPALKLNTHFSMDEKARTVALTDEGVARAEEILHLENLYDPNNISYQHHILQALKATHLFKRDVDYLVNEGQVVKAGQQIAEMGRSGAARDMLHFEIRHDGKPVDPLGYLPKR